jgi:chaperonin cofactor prefoldin
MDDLKESLSQLETVLDYLEHEQVSLTKRILEIKSIVEDMKGDIRYISRTKEKGVDVNRNT